MRLAHVMPVVWAVRMFTPIMFMGVSVGSVRVVINRRTIVAVPDRRVVVMMVMVAMGANDDAWHTNAYVYVHIGFGGSAEQPRTQYQPKYE